MHLKAPAQGLGLAEESIRRRIDRIKQSYPALQLKATNDTNAHRIGNPKTAKAVLGPRVRVSKPPSFRKPAKKPTRARQGDLIKKAKGLKEEIEKAGEELIKVELEDSDS